MLINSLSRLVQYLSAAVLILVLMLVQQTKSVDFKFQFYSPGHFQSQFQSSRRKFAELQFQSPLVLVTQLTQVSHQNECDHTSHTVRSTHCCRLSSTRIFVVTYDRLTKSSDEMSTKTSRILVIVSVKWSNFSCHSFSFVDENQRLLVIVFVSMTKINLFLLTKFQFQFQQTKKH